MQNLIKELEQPSSNIIGETVAVSAIKLRAAREIKHLAALAIADREARIKLQEQFEQQLNLCDKSHLTAIQECLDKITELQAQLEPIDYTEISEANNRDRE